MRVETEQPELADHLHGLARTLRANGGFVADDFTVRERSGQFSCAIAERIGEPDRLLVSYPTELQVPMWHLQWADSDELLEPSGGLEGLTTVQRTLLDDWLPLVNATGRLRYVRAAVPKYAVQSWALRHHLADGGYPVMRDAPADLDPRDTVIGWHSGGGAQPPDSGTESEGGPRWRLIPLKHLLNHDPTGAGQSPVPNRVAVATSASSNHEETYENYGDLDALQLLMGFGYVDSQAQLVHSVPVEVDSDVFGKVVVRWRAPRYGRRASAASAIAPHVPQLSRGEGGIALRHLTFRPGNRGQVTQLLAMAVQSGAGTTKDAAVNHAEQILDRILEANATYYRTLDRLVAAAAEATSPGLVLPALAQVSLLQQQRLAALWR